MVTILRRFHRWLRLQANKANNSYYSSPYDFAHMRQGGLRILVDIFS